jgi:serine phosphatase RsbU (regulator of sigma subunit)/pSer/pThr/pTyr-binding forkhead associated (FHA) protein
MTGLRFQVHDASGEREIAIAQVPFTIGRRETNDLRLSGSEVSREHAEVVVDNGRVLIRDRESRYGTFVNGEAVAECELRPGDRLRLGRGGGADLVVLSDDASSIGRSATGARDDLRQITALLAGFRALGSGRVLQDVLALVLDASLEVSGAERAFIMLAAQDGSLEFKLARGRNKQTLTDATFATSRKIPEEVFTAGQTKVVADLLDAGLAGVHMGTVALGIRHVVCVPLNFVQYVDSAEARGEDRRIGVLYLDSRERGSLASETTRAALETLASEASVAIENARLYREKLEKAKLEHEMRIAAEIQQALLPRAQPSLGFVEAAAASVPCRSIGGDFFDYLDHAGSTFGFTLGDVAGKGPPAALLSALMQGMLTAYAYAPDGPSTAVAHINRALYRRGIESRFVTILLGSLTADGRLTYCNGGHNPPFVIGRTGVRRLEAGGPVVGLLETAAFAQDSLQLDPGDVVVIFSDGVSEAMNTASDEFGDARLLEVAQANVGEPVQVQVERIVAAVRAFAHGAPQSDDVTVMVVRYVGTAAA